MYYSLLYSYNIIIMVSTTASYSIDKKFKKPKETSLLAKLILYTPIILLVIYLIGTHENEVSKDVIKKHDIK